ncbi:hypothetical protein [Winogradskyella sp. UBA3174]|uniref:hypothetical protein n=1 Tax=Winogradskyella sp. UBA3174 TaxID=1947785 RepID=UPI0025D4EE32|nr:hypothetical protein [Winogradskyella sp. UBA3174]|tara:strand:+ start:7716 stop:8192 length:477 start_codon:yes stop_codon:yes gene_type:complete
MNIRTEVIIQKKANDIWQVIGIQFDKIHAWASFFKDSKPSGENKFDGINFSARDTVVEGGTNTHSLDLFDSEHYILSYTVTAGAPPFANKAGAEWALEIIDENTSKASITVKLELKEGITEEKVSEVKSWLHKSSNDMLEDLKHYVETGNLYPRKHNA